MTNASAIVAVQTAIFNENIIEISPNNGFTCKDNPEAGEQYQVEMEAVGWENHDEWCAYSAILAWKLGYIHNEHQDVWKYFSKLASGNSQQMARNAHQDKFWPTGIVPRPGCIVIWAHGDSITVGHTGLCIDVSADGKTFTTLEGNSAPPNSGNEREGYTIAKHVHTLNAPHSANGLNYVRSIYVVENLPS